VVNPFGADREDQQLEEFTEQAVRGQLLAGRRSTCGEVGLMHNKEPPTLPYLVEPYEYDYEVQVFSLEQGSFPRPSQTFR
jgi:hypothetical protein